jgi:branched-chain amino acid transport system permease protein
MKNIIDYIVDYFKRIVLAFKTDTMYRRFVYLFIGLNIILLLSELDVMKYSTVSLFAYIIIFTVVALGLNILLGFSGLMSLGTAGFVGFGAYGVVYFETLGFPYEIAGLITIVVASLLGLAVGLFSLKVEGVYLAISTLAVGEIFSQVFRRVTWFTNAFGGVHYKYPTLFGLIELDRNATYVFLTFVMVLMMVVMYHLTKSKTGRAMLAMSRSNSSAQAMGVSISKYRLFSFVIAILYATIGGILYASFYRYVQPLDWNLMLTLLILAMVVVGGMKSIFGTFLGVFIIYGIPKLYLEELFSGVSGVAYLFSGILIIAVVMFYPYGMIHVSHDIKKLYYKFKLHRQNQLKAGDGDE